MFINPDVGEGRGGGGSGNVLAVGRNITYVPESDPKVSSDAPKALKSIKLIFKSNIWTLKWKKTEILASFLSRTCALLD